jgi:hypothetical protein
VTSEHFDFVKLRRQFRTDHRLLFEAAVWLAFARLTIPIIPFRWTIKLLAFKPCDHTLRKQIAHNPACRAFSRRAHRALRVASTCAPWRSNCLALALAGATMLRRRQLPGTLALGVIKNPAKVGGLEAHAWLSAGGIIVTGGAGHKTYHVIAIYSHS